MSQFDSWVTEPKMRMYKWKHAIHYHNGRGAKRGGDGGGGLLAAAVWRFLSSGAHRAARSAARKPTRPPASPNARPPACRCPHTYPPARRGMMYINGIKSAVSIGSVSEQVLRRMFAKN